MGKISGDVAREAHMLQRSYRDPVEQHEAKLTNRYSLDFGDATGKFLSKVGMMALNKRKKQWDDLQLQKNKDKEHYEKNQRFILNDRYYKTKRWNQNVNSREMLIGTYKLDKKVLYTPEQSLKTLKHSVTEAKLHQTNKFRIPKRQNELFAVESTHVQ
jgi:hypothetical protein